MTIGDATVTGPGGAQQRSSRSASVLVLRHDVTVPQGRLAATLGPAATELRLDLGAPLPADADGWDGIVVLGGPMGAYDENRYPFLAGEKTFLRRAVERGVPVLGICLGCQLLADALGGTAYLAPELEAAFAPCELTSAGAEDPVARFLAGPVLTLHQDTWDPPPGAVMLATSDRYPQAFRLGSALGMQPHPEAGPELAAAWIDHLGRNRVAAAGADPDALLEKIRMGRPASDELAAELFGAWLTGLTS